MPRAPSSLSRASSTTSIESSTSSMDAVAPMARRTRKRFSNDQITLLENLFRKSSHPSREDREQLSVAAGIELRSITIWFQNKRQAERKNHGLVQPRPALQKYEPYPPNCSPRPSLDRIASRSERAVPTTPTHKSRNPGRAIWEAMPSSPVDPVSPGYRDYVEFGGKHQRTRTLEWACERRRMAEKVGEIIVDDEEEESDDGSHEAITPPPTNTSITFGSKGEPTESKLSGMVSRRQETPDSEDAEMMDAALALCGLGRSR